MCVWGFCVTFNPSAGAAVGAAVGANHVASKENLTRGPESQPIRKFSAHSGEDLKNISVGIISQRQREFYKKIKNRIIVRKHVT